MFKFIKRAAKAYKSLLMQDPGLFRCPACGCDTFTMMTNPVHSTSRIGSSRTKVMSACNGGCGMRYVFVSDDYGKTWDPYAPSN